MNQPPGFVSNSPHLVCKLHKDLYGLNQAPRSGFQKLSTTLQAFGFHFFKSDSSLFVQFHSSYTIFILIYVDDIIITGSCIQEVQNLIFKLNYCFACKDLGPLHYFLDVQVNRLPNGGLHLSSINILMISLYVQTCMLLNHYPHP